MSLSDDEWNMLLWLFFEQGLWMVWITSPLWWPALKMLLPRYRLPHPVAYTLISAALAYGLIAASCIVVLIPVKVAALYLAQQFIDFGIPFGHHLRTADTVVTALQVPLLISLPFSSWWGSRVLARHWPALCDRVTGVSGGAGK